MPKSDADFHEDRYTLGNFYVKRRSFGNPHRDGVADTGRAIRYFYFGTNGHSH